MVYNTSESAQNCLRNMRMTVGEYDNDTAEVERANVDVLGCVIHHSKGIFNRFPTMYNTTQSVENCTC